SQLTLTRTTIDANTAEEGGALWSDHGTATVTIVDSTIADNTSDVFDAGAVFVRGNTVIRGSTFSGNAALAGRGGALFGRGDPSPATLAITNSTFSGNHAKTFAGAIYVSDDLTTHLASVTIAGNTVGDETVPSGGVGGG